MDILKFAFKHSKNLLPTAITSMLNKDQYTHQYNTRNRQIGQISQHSTTIFNKSFLCKMKSLWLPLPSQLKNVCNLNIFSKGTAKYILSKY